MHLAGVHIAGYYCTNTDYNILLSTDCLKGRKKIHKVSHNRVINWLPIRRFSNKNHPHAINIARIESRLAPFSVPKGARPNRLNLVLK